MAVFRIHKTKNYTVMSDFHFREKNMTLKAKGLLSLMLSLPDDWNYSVAGLVTLSKDGKDSVIAALAELEHFGYLVRRQLYNDKGQFNGVEYCIYEKSQKRMDEPVKDEEERQEIENPCLKVLELFNSICKSLPQVLNMSEKRAAEIAERLEKYTLEQFKDLFTKAENSAFLKGENDRRWRATFDWLIREENMLKVLEGNYNVNGACDVSNEFDDLTELTRERIRRAECGAE
jgi:hypothetical protein